MTEQDWLDCTDSMEMLTFLQGSGRLSERKARLFAVACCDRMEELLIDKRSRRAVRAAERFADGQVGKRELARINESAQRACGWVVRSREGASTLYRQAVCAAACAAFQTTILPNGEVFLAARLAVTARLPQTCDQDYDRSAWEEAAVKAALERVVDAEYCQQAGLLRDVFGPLPFRSVQLDRTVLSWNDGTVRRLAETIYEGRSLPDGHLDTTRLGVLGDALVDAGCGNPDVLNHCRQPGPHVRGCWLLDLLLGKD